MPELPEVEVVKLFLEEKISGQKIIDLKVINQKSFIGNPSDVVGQTIVGFSRIGKQLSIHLSNKLILLVHLKMTGQLIFVDSDRTILGHPTKDSTQSLPNKSTRIIFHFSPTSSRGAPKGQGVLYFNDQRKFGWIKLLTQAELVEAQQPLGLDIFDTKFTPEYLFSQLQRTSRPIKLALLDQHFFAGIGNIYANDALFLSGVHPLLKSNNTTLSQAKLIHRHLVAIMQQSVLAGGSTAKDNKYVRPDGTYGSNQFLFRVYQREGEPCLQCGAKIKKIQLGGRGTFFCPSCQKLS